MQAPHARPNWARNFNRDRMIAAEVQREEKRRRRRSAIVLLHFRPVRDSNAERVLGDREDPSLRLDVHRNHP